MRISYAGDHVLTGDEAALLMLEFAGELGKRGSTETVQLNIVQPSGESGIARFLIGPASQIIISSHFTAIADPDNSDAMSFMQSRMGQMSVYGDREAGDDS